MKKEKKMGLFELITTHFINEMKMIFSDKGAILILVIAMVVYPIIYSIGYINEVVTDLPIAVVDLDRTALSKEYTLMLDATPELEIKYKPTSLKEAEDLFLIGDIEGIILIDENFEEDICQERSAHVSIYADAGYFLNYRNEFMATTFTNSAFASKISIDRYVTDGKSLREAIAFDSPLDIQTHVLYNPSSAYGTFIMPGMMLIILQQTLLIGIGLMGGSFSESKASPFILPEKYRYKEILPYLIGKSGVYIIVSLFNIAMALVIVHDWFQYPEKGSFIDVLMLMFPYLIAVIFLGIGLSTLFVHRESAIVFMVFLSPIALFLSGLSWPVSAMTDFMQQLSLLMPSSTAVPAYLRIRTMGASILDVKTELLFLYKQAGIYLGITVVSYFFKVLVVDKLKAGKNTTEVKHS